MKMLFLIALNFAYCGRKEPWSKMSKKTARKGFMCVKLFPHTSQHCVVSKNTVLRFHFAGD